MWILEGVYTMWIIIREPPLGRDPTRTCWITTAHGKITETTGIYNWSTCKTAFCFLIHRQHLRTMTHLGLCLKAGVSGRLQSCPLCLYFILSSNIHLENFYMFFYVDVNMPLLLLFRKAHWSKWACLLCQSQEQNNSMGGPQNTRVSCQIRISNHKNSLQNSLTK